LEQKQKVRKYHYFEKHGVFFGDKKKIFFNKTAGSDLGGCVA